MTNRPPLAMPSIGEVLQGLSGPWSAKVSSAQQAAAGETTTPASPDKPACDSGLSTQRAKQPTLTTAPRAQGQAPSADNAQLGAGAPTNQGFQTRPAQTGLSSAAKKDAGIHNRVVRLVDAKMSRDDALALDKAQLAFLPNWAVTAAFPYQDLGPDVTVWSRSSKRHGIVLQSGVYRDPNDPSRFLPLGLPYGVYARYLLIWITTVVQSAAHRNKLQGNPLDAKSLRCLDLSGPHGGIALEEFLFRGRGTVSYGPRGTLAAVCRQLQRLAGLKLAVTHNPQDLTWANNQMLLMDASSVTTLLGISGKDIWQARIELSERFYETILESSVPLDWDIVHALGKSPQAIDLYVWLSHQCFVNNTYRQKVLQFSWAELQDYFGGDAKSRHKFNELFKRSLNSLRVLWPALDKGCTVYHDGISLQPGIELTVQRTSANKIISRAG